MKLINSILVDIVCIALIIFFIDKMYRLRYGGTNYMKNQLGFFGASNISLLIILKMYYFIENMFHIDSLYMNGICLTLFYLLGGFSTRLLYKHVFFTEKSLYKPTKEEYLFMVMASFISISIKLVSERIIGFTIPIALLLGRFIWFDTQSLSSIKESIKVNHNRIVETSILYILGILLISLIMFFTTMPSDIEINIAILYGIVIFFLGKNYIYLK